jgi:hypothetical protein
MRINIKDLYINELKNWQFYPHRLKNKQKLQIASSLIEKGHVKLKYQKITNPNFKVPNNSWTQRHHLDSKYDYSLINTYLYRSQLRQWKRPYQETDTTLIYRPRRETTYQHKLHLQNTSKEKHDTLDYIIFLSGWASSIKHASHLIRQGNFTLNSRIIKNPKLVPQKGSLLVNLNPLYLFQYFRQRYYATNITTVYWKKWTQRRSNISLQSKDTIQKNPTSALKRLHTLKKLLNLFKVKSRKKFRWKIKMKKGRKRTTPKQLQKTIPKRRSRYFRYPFAVQPLNITKIAPNKVIFS